MSHFTRIKTRMMVRSHIVTALTELGYKVEEGEALDIRGYTAKTAKAEIRVKTKSRYDIGFVRSRDESYSIVADWYGVRGVKQAAFKQAVNQRYATIAVKEKLADQGFELIDEKNEENGQTRLVLRRMA